MFEKVSENIWTQTWATLVYPANSKTRGRPSYIFKNTSGKQRRKNMSSASLPSHQRNETRNIAVNLWFLLLLNSAGTPWLDVSWWGARRGGGGRLVSRGGDGRRRSWESLPTCRRIFCSSPEVVQHSVQVEVTDTMTFWAGAIPACFFLLNRLPAASSNSTLF